MIGITKEDVKKIELWASIQVDAALTRHLEISDGIKIDNITISECVVHLYDDTTLALLVRALDIPLSTVETYTKEYDDLTFLSRCFFYRGVKFYVWNTHITDSDFETAVNNIKILD